MQTVSNACALNAPSHNHDKEGNYQIEGSELHKLNKGKMSRVKPHKTSKRNRRNANGAIGRRNAIGKQAQKHRGERLKTKTSKHARRNSNGGAKAGHALHKATEAPSNEQRKQTAVARDGGNHGSNNIHGTRAHAEVVRKHGGDDNKHDGPQCHQEALKACGSNLVYRKLPHQTGKYAREYERTNGSFPCRPLEDEQNDDEPKDRHEREQKLNDIHKVKNSLMVLFRRKANPTSRRWSDTVLSISKKFR